MPRKTVTKTIVEEPKDDPSVVAYRVGKLEEAVSLGFEKVHNKLDELKDGFVTHELLDEKLRESEKVHADFETRIRSLEADRLRSNGRILGIDGTWAKIVALLTFLAAALGAMWWVVDLLKAIKK